MAKNNGGYGLEYFSSRPNSIASRGRDRRGYRGHDLLKESSFDNTFTSPRVEIPFDMLSASVENDKLTAVDQAVFFFLVAVLRRDMSRSEKLLETASVTCGDVMRYLGSKNPSRVCESLFRLSRAQVQYERLHGLKKPRPVRLVSIGNLPERMKSRTQFQFGFDPAVVRTMQLSKRYVMLDLNALTRFSSRYTARLYSRLSVLSQQHAELRRAWEVAPRELAVALGYPLRHFHIGNFSAAVGNAVSEINGLPDFVKRCDVDYSAPNTLSPKFAFQTSDERRDVFDSPAAWLSDEAMLHACAFKSFGKAAQLNMAGDQHIHPLRIGQAQAFYGVKGLSVSKAWREAVTAANFAVGNDCRVAPKSEKLSKERYQERRELFNPDAPVAGISAEAFLGIIETFGIAAGFKIWIDNCHSDLEAVKRREERASTRDSASPLPPTCRVCDEDPEEDFATSFLDDFMLDSLEAA